MSCGLLFHQLFFRREVGVEEGDEDDGEGNDGNPDRLADEEMAEDRANYRAKCEEKKHSGVSGPLFPMGFVAALAVVQFLCQAYAYLTDVVCYKGRGDCDAFGLTEGVILHGRNEIYDDLGDLHGRRLGEQTQDEHRDHLDENQNRIPAHKKAVLYGVRDKLGDKGTEDIRGYWNKVVEPFTPLCRAQSQTHEHDVAGLRVAEDVAAQKIGVCSPEAGNGYKCEVYPVPFAGQVVLVVLFTGFQYARPFRVKGPLILCIYCRSRISP